MLVSEGASEMRNFKPLASMRVGELVNVTAIVQYC